MPDRKTIRDALLSGIRSANKRYEGWSNGSWLSDYGVEGLMVAVIAETLDSGMGERQSLAIEVPFQEIIDWSGAGRRPGRPLANLNGKNKADIVLFNGNDRPVCVVEVKRLWRRDPCFNDLTRIRDLVLRCNSERNGSLRRGFLALMLAKPATASRTATQRIDRQAETIEASIGQRFDSRGLTVRCHRSGARRYPEKYRNAYDLGEWAHAGFCVELSSDNAKPA